MNKTHRNRKQCVLFLRVFMPNFEKVGAFWFRIVRMYVCMYVCMQGQLLEGVECHIYLYCFTFDDINLNRALVIIVLFPTKYCNKKVCGNDIRK